MAFAYLLLGTVISSSIAFLFENYLKIRINSNALRAVLVGLAFLGSVATFIGGSVYLFFSWMYPTTNKAIDSEYSFTQRPYGFTTTPTNGYFLTFYRTNDFWFDDEIGKINLECIGTENVNAKIKYGHEDYNRLLVQLDNETKVDTMLHFEKHFDFKYQAYK
ncbi:MAG: hypothetical protein ACRYFX_17650 [Janthinobacterium lividum]